MPGKFRLSTGIAIWQDAALMRDRDCLVAAVHLGPQRVIRACRYPDVDVTDTPRSSWTNHDRHGHVVNVTDTPLSSRTRHAHHGHVMNVTDTS